MSSANGRIAQKLEAMVVTMELLCNKMREVSTTSFENSMNSGKVQDVKDKLTTVETRLAELHDLLGIAAASSTDTDVAYRSGGGGGKG